MDRHLRSLIARHRAIDREIERESVKPRPDAGLRALKRLRLAIKDRIAALQSLATDQVARRNRRSV